MFVNLFIKGAQLLSAAMVPQEDVSKWLICNLFFLYWSQRYRKYIKFNGMKGAVNCLSFNASGDLLASGGS